MRVGITKYQYLNQTVTTKRYPRHPRAAPRDPWESLRYTPSPQGTSLRYAPKVRPQGTPLRHALKVRPQGTPLRYTLRYTPKVRPLNLGAEAE